MPLLFGVDSTGDAHPLLVDTSGRVIPTYREEQGFAKVATAYGADGLAPHAITTRFTYTVPAATKARLELACVYLVRATAPSAAGMAFVRVTYTPAGGSGVDILRVAELSLTVGGGHSQSLGYSILLGPGDVLAGQTRDQSTGGTYDMSLSVVLTEMTA